MYCRMVEAKWLPSCAHVNFNSQFKGSQDEMTPIQLDLLKAKGLK